MMFRRNQKAIIYTPIESKHYHIGQQVKVIDIIQAASIGNGYYLAEVDGKKHRVSINKVAVIEPIDDTKFSYPIITNWQLTDSAGLYGSNWEYVDKTVIEMEKLLPLNTFTTKQLKTIKYANAYDAHWSLVYGNMNKWIKEKEIKNE